MPYHGGHELMVKLSTLLHLHGDPILRQGEPAQGTNDRGTNQQREVHISYRDKAAITFLLDFLRRTPSLRLVPGACSHFDGLVNISCFRALQVLEIKKVPVGFIRGFQSLRPQLKTLICKKSLISLNEVLVHCGGDLLNAPSAWPHLKNVDFSYNGIVQLDNSVKLLPAVKILNLSHNNIHTAQDDNESLCNWQYLSDVQHLNVGFNQMDCIPVPLAQVGLITFQNMTTLLLKNNNLQNLKGLQAFSKLRFLDVSFNCIASLSELTPLAFLHDLISLNLQGNPVVFCPFYRRATIACLYPIPRVEPIKIDEKPLDSEEQVLLGRNVYPVSMLSYIPETPLPHPRVRAIRKVATEDLPESSESQEESDSNA
ncbi:protein kinase binding [Desmophyllum pertusum]|uniref:Protein kinase binding n=1 Tax=Desmophyllum pertusum TaxID=174260 RepID=A0A9X0D905_9CNID|nr:protein kinase binding [Desmophyllum pertusum]